MGKQFRILYLIAVILFVSGCDVSSSIEFKGSRAKSSSIPVAKELAITSGGKFKRNTASGYTVDFSVNAPIGMVHRKTDSGHHVLLNISGQTAD